MVLLSYNVALGGRDPKASSHSFPIRVNTFQQSVQVRESQCGICSLHCTINQNLISIALWQPLPYWQKLKYFCNTKATGLGKIFNPVKITFSYMIDQTVYLPGVCLINALAVIIASGCPR